MTGDSITPDTTTAARAQGSVNGLSSAEVTDLRQRFGFNDLPEEKKHPLLKFLSYFWGPIPWMIEAAAILSAAIANWEDFAVILLLLMTNAVVGFLQERKAENAIELLKKQLAPNARVLRNGYLAGIPGPRTRTRGYRPHPAWGYRAGQMLSWETGNTSFSMNRH